MDPSLYVPLLSCACDILLHFCACRCSRRRRLKLRVLVRTWLLKFNMFCLCWANGDRLLVIVDYERRALCHIFALSALGIDYRRSITICSSWWYYVCLWWSFFLHKLFYCSPLNVYLVWNLALLFAATILSLFVLAYLHKTKSWVWVPFCIDIIPSCTSFLRFISTRFERRDYKVNRKNHKHM